jgi:hypothetical protein
MAKKRKEKSECLQTHAIRRIRTSVSLAKYKKSHFWGSLQGHDSLFEQVLGDQSGKEQARGLDEKNATPDLVHAARRIRTSACPFKVMNLILEF